MAAGLAVVPVAAQVDLQRQQAVGGGTILAALIWRLRGAGLQGAGLFGHRFGEGVAASDQLPALVTLDIPHPHTHATRLCALRPGRGVPFEAWSLKAGVFLFGLLAASTRLLIKDLELSSTDADAEDEPVLHTSTTGCVTPLPVLAQPVWSTVSLPTGVDGQRLFLRRALVLRNHATLWSLTVHMTHRLPLAARP